MLLTERSFAQGRHAQIAATTVTLSNLVVADTANAAHWSLQTNLQVSAVQYGDRGYTFLTLPATLQGAAWVRTANSSKAYTSNPTVTFTIDQSATVYLILDTRIPQPTWVDATWTLTTLTATNNEAVGYNSFAIYSKTFAAGQVPLGSNDNGNTTVNMYSVAVLAAGTSTPTPTATTGVGTPTPTATLAPTSTPTLPPTATTVPNTPTPTATSVSGPVTLSNLVVADTANAANWSLQTNLQIGNVLYGDRGYTIAALPAALVGAAWVRTANSSKAYTGSPTATFSINVPATVYATFDTRVTPLPAWIDSSWTNTNMTLTSNQAVGYNAFIVYAKSFPAGAVALGQNDNGSTAVNMYTVAVVGNGTVTPTPTGMPTATPTPNPGIADWPQYLHDLGGSDYNSSETTLTASNIGTITPKWTANGGGGMSAQPIETNNVVYWGSWDGNMHATNVTGANAGKDIWATNLGVTTAANCVPSVAGVASTAAYGMVGTTPAIFVGGGGNDAVGGGNVYVYALNAATGAIMWKAIVGSSPSDFAWSSPLLYQGSVYYGVASFGDCPLTRGRLVKLNQATGTLQATTYTAPVNCVGGGIWGTPTIDTATGMLYVSTGTPSNCSGTTDDSAAVVEINATSMAVIAKWQVPVAQQVPDSDFGSAPTLFAGGGKQLVGVANKNGLFYTFDRTNIAAGPIWSLLVAVGGSGPQGGGGSISPAAWDGTNLYVTGGNTTIGGASCKSSVRALNPATGAIIWEHCLNNGPALSSLTEIPGVVVVTEGAWVQSLSTVNGATLFSYHDTGTGSIYYSPVAIANGYMFAPNLDGNFVALSL